MDFGHCEFPADANDVIADYFSTPADETVEVGSTDEENEPSQFFDNDPPSIPHTLTQETQPNEVDVFLSKDCCSRKFSSQFKKDLIAATRDSSKANHYRCPEHINHLHLILLGQLSALTNEDDTSTHQRTSSEREKPRIKYNCGERRLMNLRLQLKNTGLEAKVHGLQGRPPKHTTSKEKVEEFKTFMMNFCDAQALVLPGKTPFKNINDPTLAQQFH